MNTYVDMERDEGGREEFQLTNKNVHDTHVEKKFFWKILELLLVTK